jgi:diguanylate cyclase (GGDEF)-like protein
VTLRSRLAIVLTVTVLVPLLAVGAVVGLLVPHLAADSAREHVAVTLRSAGTLLEQRCATLGTAARGLAVEVAPALAAGQAPDPAALTTATAAAATSVPGASAAVLDADGRVLGASGPTELTGIPGRSCAAASAGSSAGSAAPAQVQAVPVRDGAGAVVAYAVTSAPLDDGALEQLRRQAALPSGLALVADGAVLSASVPGAGGGLEDLARRADASLAGARTGQSGDLLFAVRPPGRGVPATLVAIEPAGSSALTWAVPLLLVVAGLLAVAGTVVLARRLTSPLADLTDAVTRLGDGDLTTRTVVRGGDEVGRLAAAVNTMADALERSLADAEAGRDALADSLERFSEALGRTHDLDGLLQTVAEAAASAAGAGTAAVYLRGASGPSERAVVDVGGRAAATGEVLMRLAEAAIGSAREVAEPDPDAPTAVGLPLLHGERVLGAIVLAAPEPLSGQDLAAARSLVRPAGTAVSNVLAHEEAARLSVTDPLTGAANFRSLSTTLAREVERAARFDRPLSVLMLDLDEFKRVNDTWGHACGDAVLRELSRRLSEVVREVDTVARYGGEEFALVLPETDTPGAEEVARRVVEVVRADPFGTVGDDSRPLRVTISAGVATYPRHGRTAGEVMRRADQALYRAKAAGRDRWAVAALPDAPVAPGG